ncbi:hypothetical protein COP2_007537 [Malus domestica]
MNNTTFGSDHSPVLMKCGAQPGRKKKRFHFEVFWTKDGECKDIVQKAWTNGRERCLIDGWNFKLNLCCNKLIRWSNDKFRKRGKQIGEMMTHLENLQQNWRENVKEISKVSKVVDNLRQQEESYWLQRS